MRARIAFQIHFFENYTSIFNLLSGNHFQVANFGFGIGSSIGFDQANDDTVALLAQQVGIFQHLVCLANAWSCTNVDAQPGVLSLLKFGEQSLCAWPGISALRHGVFLSFERLAREPVSRRVKVSVDPQCEAGQINCRHDASVSAMDLTAIGHD